MTFTVIVVNIRDTDSDMELGEVQEFKRLKEDQVNRILDLFDRNEYETWVIEEEKEDAS